MLPDITVIENYSIPEPNSGCWIWIGSNSGRYGNFYKNGKNYAAHRLSHELYKGPIPYKFDVDHLCRNTFCVNPDHLEAVPHALNNQRAFPNHCKHGHLLTDDNIIKLSYQRRCKACHRDLMAKYARNKRMLAHGN